MLHWKFVLEVGLPAAVAFIAILVILYNFFCCRAAPRHEHLQGADVNECRSRPDHADANIVHERQRSQGKLSNGLPKFRKDSFEVALKNSSKVASVCRSTHPFDWSEHPDLVAEAVEHGWSAFAFTYTCSIYPSCSNFWDKFRSSSHKHEYEPDLSWEVGASSEYMQKLWLNPGLILKKENCGSSVQALQASLPLPGPPLGSLSFPQEGYYEITIVADGNADAPRSSYVETEQGKLMSRHLLSGKHMGSEIFSEAKLDPSGDMQLMKDGSKSSKLSETLHNLSSHIEISKFVARDNPLAENLQILAIGLAAGGASPFRFPGLDIGSVGFHSDGRVYVNGRPFVFLGTFVSLLTMRKELDSRGVELSHSFLALKGFPLQ
ncbi:hypothetical protein KP509_28G018500 [Ceratopteris richardii]|uniref:Uncharacterized protein n=1 Tax=Ceratopteris richardii TaxID=49495 RepID=A0A8T2RA00_CERRI|nr:hypothetical protein KP509_28G018500 [Ceratopteris richardii]